MRSPVAERARTCKHDFKIAKVRQDLFDSRECNQGAREGEAHATVALGLDDRNGAGFGDEKIGTADCGGNAEKLLAQIGAGRSGERLGSSERSGQAHPAREDFADLARLTCSAGTTICDGSSSPSCRISSARSVSMA